MDSSPFRVRPTIAYLMLKNNEPYRYATPKLMAQKFTALDRAASGKISKSRKGKPGPTAQARAGLALKMILSGQLAGEEEVRRFRAEGEAAANLDHPRIVPIHEIGEHDGQPYCSMGYVECRSLAARLAEGPLSPREAVALVRKIAQAVAYANDKGVIHRDLKPGNVLLDANGEPRVTDFGLAKRIGNDSDLTTTGQILGTPSYMPPEQALGLTQQVDQRSDVYALGAVLYASLTGRPPHQAANPLETIKAVIEQEPVAPRKLDRTVPRDLETICLKAIAKEPDRRYPSASALADDLGHYCGSPRESAGESVAVATAESADAAQFYALLEEVCLVFTPGLIAKSVAVNGECQDTVGFTPS